MSDTIRPFGPPEEDRYAIQLARHIGHEIRVSLHDMAAFQASGESRSAMLREQKLYEDIQDSCIRHLKDHGRLLAAVRKELTDILVATPPNPIVFVQPGQTEAQ